MDKKKRNKKKNNKQKKATEDAAIASVSDQTSSHQEGNDAPDLVHPDQSNESQSLHVSHSNGTTEFPVENNGNLVAGSDGSAVVEAKERQDWIKEEARLNMMVKELQIEKESWIQNEARLNMMIKELQIEKESRIQKEDELEMKLIKLQDEKEVSHQKEMFLEDKISQLVLKNDTLHIEKKKMLENFRLLEREKALWIQEEDSLKQKFTAVNDENTRTRAQVMESEEFTKQLLLEKHQLMENLSTLQSRIEELERNLAFAHSSTDITNDSKKIDDLNSEIDAACQLVEKLITENADLVEKMNELYMELGYWQAKDGNFSISVPAISHPDSEFSNEIAISTENANINSSDRVLMEEEMFTEPTMSGEIVQIPLDEHEIQDLEGQQLIDENTNDGVPLSDSPLVGAPFRLISFMAKYVTGADLVRDDHSSV